MGEVKATVFGEYEDIEYIGKVSKIDKQLRKIKIESVDDDSCINIDEIILIDKI